VVPSGVVGGSVSLTFGSKVKVWETNSKLDANGVSSQVSSGTLFAVADLPKMLYLEGVSGSSTFRDMEVKAEHATYGCYDVVKVTVFEVTLNGLFGFGPQQGDDERRMHDFKPGSSDNCGKISWDDADADGVKGDPDPNCNYFGNCMECQGTVDPNGVTSEVEFDFKRDKWRRVWGKVAAGAPWNLISDATPWQPDAVAPDLTPSTMNHIYNTDSPGFIVKKRGPYDYLELIRITEKCSEAWFSPR